MPRIARVAAVVAWAALAVRCGSTPPSPSCTYAVTPTGVNLAVGGSAVVTITTGSTCPWTATSNASWIAILGNPSGTGTGSVTIAAATSSVISRIGTLSVAGQTVTVTQAVTPQRFSLTGRVWETWTNVGLAGVSVTFTGGPGSGSTTTDRDGLYALGLAPGTYQLVFSRPSFQPTTMVINVSGDKTINTNLNQSRPFPLPPNDVIGYWKGGGLYPDQPMSMTLNRDGTAVWGWYRDQQSISDGVTGTYSGKTLVLRVPVADGVLTYECTIDDDRSMHGFVKNERAGRENTPIWFIRP